MLLHAVKLSAATLVRQPGSHTAFKFKLLQHVVLLKRSDVQLERKVI